MKKLNFILFYFPTFGCLLNCPLGLVNEFGQFGKMFLDDFGEHFQKDSSIGKTEIAHLKNAGWLETLDQLLRGEIAANQIQ